MGRVRMEHPLEPALSTSYRTVDREIEAPPAIVWEAGEPSTKLFWETGEPYENYTWGLGSSLHSRPLSVAKRKAG